MRRIVIVTASLAVALASVSASSSTHAATQGRWAMAGTSETVSDPGWKLTSLGEGWWPNGINERGQVVGVSQILDEGAVLWRDGRQTVLRAPADMWVTDATAINDGGDIVGAAEDFDMQSYPILWRKGVPTRVPTLSEAMDINNRGQIVGRRDGGAYVWEKGKARRLPGVACRALAINDRGVAVGACSGSKAVLWKQGQARTLVRGKSEAVDVNNRGQVVGWRMGGDGQRHGFLWQNGRVTDLGVGVLPNAINDRGQIVGSCGLRACVWQNGRIMRIECPDCDGPGRRFSEATAINERQQIVGHYSDSCASCNTIEWPYLWTRRG